MKNLIQLCLVFSSLSILAVNKTRHASTSNNVYSMRNCCKNHHDTHNNFNAKQIKKITNISSIHDLKALRNSCNYYHEILKNLKAKTKISKHDIQKLFENDPFWVQPKQACGHKKFVHTLINMTFSSQDHDDTAIKFAQKKENAFKFIQIYVGTIKAAIQNSTSECKDVGVIDDKAVSKFNSITPEMWNNIIKNAKNEFERLSQTQGKKNSLTSKNSKQEESTIDNEKKLNVAFQNILSPQSNGFLKKSNKLWISNNKKDSIFLHIQKSPKQEK